MSNPTGDALKELPPLNAELAEILGRPCFECAHIAWALRDLLGHPVERKAESEQAAVIHWTLGLYLEHGTRWREKANEILKAAKAAVDEQARRVE